MLLDRIRSNHYDLKKSGGESLSVWIDQEEEYRRLTLEALAEVDANQVIDHQSVRIWAESLNSDNPLPAPVNF